MAIKASAMLIFTDAKENNNKFYEINIEDNDLINCRWGRVGAEGQKKSYSGSMNEYNKVIRSKLAKGYVHTKTITINAKSTDKIELENAAKRDLLGISIDKKTTEEQKTLINLVEKLTTINRHQIYQASNGNITIDETGIIRTPLGLVTANTIEEARDLLNNLEKFISKKNFNDNKYIHNLEDYLKLIPQKVPPKRGWYETFFTDFSSLEKQNSFLDQLEGSIDLYKDKEKQALENAKTNKKEIPKLFNTNLELITDQKIISSITNFFDKHKNNSHVSSHLKLKNVFLMKNDAIEQNFNKISKEIKNVKRLWHGTRAFNVLSILKNGLIIPKAGAGYHINGRMFGNGIYFSDQSTKSLNYAYGYWDGGAKDNNCYMFLSDVAMGKEYIPSGPDGKISKDSLAKQGFNSTFAKSKISGVLNNEMIVYDINQVHLKYLCEFSN